MRLVLAGLVLCACGGHQSVAIANRGGPASTGCSIPARIELEARRYANLDADDKDFNVWSSWRVGIQFEDGHGTLAMVGDDLTWTFDVAGRVRDCTLELDADTHEPISVAFDLRAHTGTIRSIDDIWVLGPPFPAKRP